jgi:hypothetical protein
MQKFPAGKFHSEPPSHHSITLSAVVPLAAKLLGMLDELVPKPSIIAVLRDPNGPDVESQSRDLEEAARAIGRQILMVNAANEHEFHAAFAKVVQAGAGGLLINSSVDSGLNSIWSSTSPPQRHSASKFRPSCSRSPTR